MLKVCYVCNYFCGIQAKERLSSQTEEWTNMINRQVEEEIRMFEEHAAQVSSSSEDLFYLGTFVCLFQTTYGYSRI